MSGDDLLERMAALAGRYRRQMWEEGVVLTPPTLAPAFMGVPITTSPYIDRMTAYLIDDHLVLHEHTLEVLRIALLDHRSPGDPAVHLEASLALILRRIDAQAAAVVQGVDDMARNYAITAAHYHRARWCDMEQDRHAYVQYLQRHWAANVWECFDCGQESTAETLTAAGARLPHHNREDTP